MKKHLSVLFALTIIALTGYSQPFAKGDHLASVHIGMGGSLYDNYNYHMQFPPLGVQYEIILTDMIGIGNIGVGGYGLFSSRVWDYNQSYYKNTRYNITIGARGYYHVALNEFLDDPIFNKIDAYGGLTMGMTSRIEVETGEAAYYTNDSNRLYPVFDLFIGGRYYFNDKLAVLAEMGFNVSFLNVGITYRMIK